MADEAAQRTRRREVIDVDYDAIVIGAGMGGLAAGGILVAEGAKTLVLEQAPFVGGCASSFENSGFRFDTGACVIQIPWVHDMFFERLGFDRRDYITFIENDPTYEFLDILGGSRFTTPASLEGTAATIACWSPEDAAAFLSLVKKKGERMDGFSKVLLTTPQGRWRDLALCFAKYPRSLANIGLVMKPYGKMLKDSFHHPLTRKLLNTYSVIGGLPPSLQTSMMLWLCYAEHQGTYYPQGGMGAVPAAYARALMQVGGEVLVNARVAKVLLEKGKARGVVLRDGTVIRSKAVVANNCSLSLYLDMIGEESLPRAVVKGMKSYEFSPAVAACHLGLDYQPKLNAQHMMGLVDPELTDSFMRDIYARNIPVPQGVGLVSSPSWADPSLAPEGGGCVTFMSVAPRHPSTGASWQDMKWDYLERGIDMVDQVFIPGIKDHIVFKTIATPEDFEKRLLMPNGAIYAYSFSMLSHMTFRPSNKSRCVKNLYLCGASTHPGGSVPGSVTSGVMAAELALKDMDRRRWN